MFYKYYVKKKFTFEAAHQLDNLKYESKCKTLHGHSYTVEVKLFSNRLDEFGMVLDFNNFKPFKEYVDNNLDHSVLCTIENLSKFDKCKTTVIIPNNTTSECIAEFLADKFYELVLKNGLNHIEMIEILISETGNNQASFIRLIN